MHRLRPDSPTLARLAVVLACLVGAASFCVSFTALSEAASWAGIPLLLRPAVPIVIDASLVVFTLAAVVARGRGESERLAWAAVGFFTAVSVVINAVHAAGQAPGLQGAIGPMLSGLMPVACLISTHTVVNLLVVPPLGTAASRRRAEQRRALADQQTGAQDSEPAPTSKPKAVEAAPKAVIPAPETVRGLAAEGLSQREIAARLQTSKSTVARLLKETAAA